MANQKITELTNLPYGQIATDDFLVVVDRSQMSSPTGETKYSTFDAVAQTVTDRVTSSLVITGPDSSSIYHATDIIFEGTNFSASFSGEMATITANSSSVVIYNSGSLVHQNISSINFIGNSVSASVSGSDVSVQINTGSVSFLGLTDVIPNTFDTNSFVVTNASGSGLIFIPISSISGSGTGGSVSDIITQTTHSFQLGDVVGRSPTGSIWILSTADDPNNADALGVVSSVSGVDTFTVSYVGKITTLSGLTDGSVYYLATSSAGSAPTRNVTITEPSLSKPIYIATSTTDAVIINQRGLILEDTGSGSSISSGSFSGSFQGDGSGLTGITSSYATNSGTASLAGYADVAGVAYNADTASFTISSSYATTASYASNFASSSAIASVQYLAAPYSLTAVNTWEDVLTYTTTKAGAIIIATAQGAFRGNGDYAQARLVIGSSYGQAIGGPANLASFNPGSEKFIPLNIMETGVAAGTVVRLQIAVLGSVVIAPAEKGRAYNSVTILNTGSPTMDKVTWLHVVEI